MNGARTFATVVLPFAGGYFASYFFRTINALIAEDLSAELHFGPARLGLLTSVYFLTFALIQIPAGVLLDRFGPARVQSIFLLFAAVGAALFGTSESFEGLLVARGLIGLGVAASLIAGLKAIALSYPKERLALVNGWFIMIGTLGVVAATLPADFFVHSIGWKSLFGFMAIFCIACSTAIFAICRDPGPASPQQTSSLRIIFSDVRFWRLAPVSMMCISTAWAMHGLWAASWFYDVEGLNHQAVVRVLFVMAICLSTGALGLGLLTDHLRQRGVRPQAMLAGVIVFFISVQLALLFGVPNFSYIAWPLIAVFGAATVISYSVIAEYYPKEILGQANSALNTFHILGAFGIQAMFGMVVALWQPTLGHYPAASYKTALGLNLVVQISALAWFISPRLVSYLVVKKRTSA